MSAIFKREFKSYFATPIGYVVLAAFYFFLGLFFLTRYSQGAPDISLIIISMSTIVIFILPVLTMRIMSDDKRQKVDQALLTAPVSLTAIVMGKFFAALAVFALGFLPTVIFEIILIALVSVNIMSYLYVMLGMLLLGSALIALGMFISSLTESAVISAIITLLVNLVIIFNFSSLISVPTGTTFFGKIWAKIVEWIVLVLEKASFITTFEKFGDNVFSIADIVYFVSFAAIFLFLCVRSLEKRRWS